MRAGYEFGGWYYTDSESSISAPYPFDLGLESDVKLVAAWRSTETPAIYTVIHRTAGGKVLVQETGTGTVGETVTEIALARDDARRAGYPYVSASGITKDLSDDASNNVYEFVYSAEPSFSYTVHFYDAATGLPVAADMDFDSEQVLLDYTAPAVKSWHVLFGGQGYLSTREGGQELVFWYGKDPGPVPEPGGRARQRLPRRRRTGQKDLRDGLRHALRAEAYGGGCRPRHGRSVGPCSHRVCGRRCSRRHRRLPAQEAGSLALTL